MAISEWEQIEQLEQQIEQLLHTVTRLRSENKVLQDQLSHTLLEQKKLREKQIQATQRIKTMIKHLKEHIT